MNIIQLKKVRLYKGILFILLLCVLYNKITSPKITKTRHKSLHAIVTLSFGSFTQHDFSEGLFYSLQTNIPFYIVTDEPQCFSNSSGISIIPVNKTSGRMDIFNFKTKLFDLLPPTIDNVLYIDSDVRSISKFNETTFLELVPDNVGFVFAFESWPDLWDLNAGLFFLTKNEETLRCLDKWKENIQSGKFGNDDQAALRHTILTTKCEVGRFNNPIVTYSEDFRLWFGWKPDRIFRHYIDNAHKMGKNLCQKFRWFNIWCWISPGEDTFINVKKKVCDNLRKIL